MPQSPPASPCCGPRCLRRRGCLAPSLIRTCIRDSGARSQTELGEVLLGRAAFEVRLHSRSSSARKTTHRPMTRWIIDLVQHLKAKARTARWRQTPVARHPRQRRKTRSRTAPRARTAPVRSPARMPSCCQLANAAVSAVMPDMRAPMCTTSSGSVHDGGKVKVSPRASAEEVQTSDTRLLACCLY